MGTKAAKKAKKAIKVDKIKVRRQWKINPQTKVKDSEKHYSRPKVKKQTKKQIKQEG